MGAACCVAAGDKTIVNASGSEVLQRNVTYSPTCSFRWDNRRRVAGEDTFVSWFSDANSQNDGSAIKYESACASEDGSPSENFRSRSWRKYRTSEGTVGQVRTPSDQSVSRNMSIDVKLEQVKASVESPVTSYPSPSKLSLSLSSASSLVASPLSSRSLVNPISSTTTRWPLRSPGRHSLHQISDDQILGLKSPNRYSVSEEGLAMPLWSNESTGGSGGGSSDGWSMHAFSELMATSRRERWSFDNDTWGFHREKISKSSGRITASPSVDLQTCCVCSKLLSEKSLWSGQKIIVCNELSVVAVLTCGHVFHAECLENMTPEINKYDPACPICTMGEKKTHKLSEKAFKAEKDFKARINKRSRSRIVDSDIDHDPVAFNRLKSSGNESKASSSSMKSSFGRPFLQKHFSFGSKESRSPSENHSTRKKGFFWAKSSKM